MTSFDSETPTDLGVARDDAHYAAQLLAAAGETLLTPDDSFHYSSATYDPQRGAIVGAQLPDGRHVSLTIASLTLGVGEATLPLMGRTMAQAAAWLSDQLGTALSFPTWDLPAGPAIDYGPFSASTEQLATAAHWYAASHELLSKFEAPTGTSSELRVWPHHFDLALLVTLAPGVEASPTVGLGMTPGDASVPRPYLYVAPWPSPATLATPPLPTGRWQVEGWYGAVLEAGEFSSAAQAGTFLRAAFDLAKPVA